MVRIAVYLLIIVVTIGGTIPGDVNFDGDLNAIDLTIVSRTLTGRYTATDYQKRVADMNHDGVLDQSDLSLMMAEVSE